MVTFTDMSDLEDIERGSQPSREGNTGPVESVCGVWGVIGLIHEVDDAWHSTWRYAFRYNTTSKHVYIDKKSHDCEFLAAPIGNKHCDYSATVSVIRWATSTTGNPIISYDNGKTWTVFTPDVMGSACSFSADLFIFLGVRRTACREARCAASPLALITVCPHSGQTYRCSTICSERIICN